MNLNDLANLGQIIGALAVVISLFYVAASNSAKHERRPVRHRLGRARALRELVSFARR